MRRCLAFAATSSLLTSFVFASSQPVRGRNGIVASQNLLASEAGLETLKEGGNAIDAGRLHHQWLPDRIQYEALRFSPDTLAGLSAKGHFLSPVPDIGCAQVILYRRDEKIFEGGSDTRRTDGGVAVY
jgi:gamma-glutamyltranspeptidase